MRTLRLLGTWLQIAGALAACTAILWLVVQSLLHLSLLDVQTGSMRPAFMPGDALIIQKANIQDLHVGQIVSYHSPRNASELVTHRLVRIDLAANMIQTKGDVLSAPDPAVGTRLLAGRVVTILPDMGAKLSWLRSIPGLVICVYVPAAALALSELARLERHYRKLRTYHLFERQVI